MNILFVTGAFESHGEPLTGMPRYLYKMCRYLNTQTEHRASIVTADIENRLWDYDGVEICSVKIVSLPGREAWIHYGLNAVIRDYLLQRKISEICKEKSVDMIQYTGWFGVGILHTGKVPAVMRMSSYCKVQLTANHTKHQVHVISLMERLAARRMNVVISPSRIVADQLQKDIHRKVHVIETPFWEDCGRGQWDASVYEKQLKGKQYLLYFGRMSANKGILTIAGMIGRLLKEHQDLYFAFAGIPSSYNGVDTFRILQNKAGANRDRIVYLGNLPHEKLLPVLKNAYAVLLPSLVDNLPNSCQEAMYHGKVVIGTWNSSLDQLIDDGISGYLSIPGDEEDLLRVTEKVLNRNRDELEQASVMAHNTIMRLEPQHIVPKMLKLYESVVQKTIKTERHHSKNEFSNYHIISHWRRSRANCTNSR